MTDKTLPDLTHAATFPAGSGLLGDVGGNPRYVPDDVLYAAIKGSLAVAEWETDITGTIAVGGTAQSAASANPNRARLRIEVDPAAVDVCFIGLGTPAVVGTGAPIGPGQPYDSGYPLTAAERAAVSIISATTGVAYTVRQKVFA